LIGESRRKAGSSGLAELPAFLFSVTAGNCVIVAFARRFELLQQEAGLHWFRKLSNPEDNRAFTYAQQVSPREAGKAS